MATLPETRAELEQLRKRLFDQFQDAKATVNRPLFRPAGLA